MGSFSFLDYALSFSVLGVVASSYEFQVGGHKGWTKPTPNQTETYNNWATLNRFQVGDSLHFKYESDSVLIVNSTAYEKCNVSDPISTYEDGNTTFKIDRDGLFYFISGLTQHCKAGQKMVIRVMVQHRLEEEDNNNNNNNNNNNIDSSSSSYYNDSDLKWGPHPYLHSTLASYFLTALGVVIAILYLLM